MAPKRSDLDKVSSINNVEDANNVFPKDWFIPGKWVNFQSLKKEGFVVKDLFDRVSWTQFLALG